LSSINNGVNTISTVERFGNKNWLMCWKSHVT